MQQHDRMQCVILAGGLGTRMRAWTQRIPKALIPVRDRPFVHYQLGWLARHGVTHVVMSIGYLGGMIRDYVGDGSAWQLQVSYVDEGTELRGTGGALRFALDRGALDESFLVTYGDSFLAIDFGDVFATFLRSGKPALMTVFRNEGAFDKSNVIFDRAASVVELYDKTRTLRPLEQFQYIDYGLSAVRRDVIAGRIPPGPPFDLALLMGELSRNGELAGYEVSQRFYEIGSPDGLADFEAWLLREGT